MGFFVALGNSIGLFLIIFFTGYGIVAVPRYFWSNRTIIIKYHSLIDKLYFSYEVMMDYKKLLDECIKVFLNKELCLMVAKIPPDLKYIHDYLFKIIPEKKIIKVLDKVEINIENYDPKISYDSLIALHEQIKNSLHCYNANKTYIYLRIFKDNFRHSLFINSIIIKQLKNEKYILKDVENLDLRYFNIKDPSNKDEKLERIVYPILNIVASIIFVLFGLILIASETSLSFSTNSFSISIFSLINSVPMFDWIKIVQIKR